MFRPWIRRGDLGRSRGRSIDGRRPFLPSLGHGELDRHLPWSRRVRPQPWSRWWVSFPTIVGTREPSAPTTGSAGDAVGSASGIGRRYRRPWLGPSGEHLLPSQEKKGGRKRGIGRREERKEKREGKEASGRRRKETVKKKKEKEKEKEKKRKEKKREKRKEKSGLTGRNRVRVRNLLSPIIRNWFSQLNLNPSPNCKLGQIRTKLGPN